MSVVLKEAQMKVLPSGGTAQEQAAMAFHGHSGGHASVTPEGESATFEVNGRAAQPGAPFGRSL
jgi:hypothetical protein